MKSITVSWPINRLQVFCLRWWWWCSATSHCNGRRGSLHSTYRTPHTTPHFCLSAIIYYNNPPHLPQWLRMISGCIILSCSCSCVVCLSVHPFLLLLSFARCPPRSSCNINDYPVQNQIQFHTLASSSSSVINSIDSLSPYSFPLFFSFYLSVSALSPLLTKIISDLSFPF